MQEKVKDRILVDISVYHYRLCKKSFSAQVTFTFKLATCSLHPANCLVMIIVCAKQF